MDHATWYSRRQILSNAELDNCPKPPKNHTEKSGGGLPLGISFIMSPMKVFQCQGENKQERLVHPAWKISTKLEFWKKNIGPGPGWSSSTTTWCLAHLQKIQPVSFVNKVWSDDHEPSTCTTSWLEGHSRLQEV